MAEYKENNNLINNDEYLKTMLEDQLEANKAKIEAEMKAQAEDPSETYEDIVDEMFEDLGAML